jgi:hypothetical protein
VESSSTDDSRLRGARPKFDIAAKSITQDVYGAGLLIL